MKPKNRKPNQLKKKSNKSPLKTKPVKVAKIKKTNKGLVISFTKA